MLPISFKHCESCCLIDSKATGNSYHNILSRGGLKVASVALRNYVAACFSTLDSCEDIIRKSNATARQLGEFILNKVLSNDEHGFTCNNYEADWCSKIIRTVTNIFFNNQRKRSTDGVVKDRVRDFKRCKLIK